MLIKVFHYIMSDLDFNVSTDKRNDQQYDVVTQGNTDCKQVNPTNAFRHVCIVMITAVRQN